MNWEQQVAFDKALETYLANPDDADACRELAGFVPLLQEDLMKVYSSTRSMRSVLAQIGKHSTIWVPASIIGGGWYKITGCHSDQPKLVPAKFPQTLIGAIVSNVKQVGSE